VPLLLARNSAQTFPAVNETCLQPQVRIHGELSRECAELYYLYGTALTLEVIPSLLVKDCSSLGDVLLRNWHSSPRNRPLTGRSDGWRRSVWAWSSEAASYSCSGQLAPTSGHDHNMSNIETTYTRMKMRISAYVQFIFPYGCASILVIYDFPLFAIPVS
jgi:hypothetical protein